MRKCFAAAAIATGLACVPGAHAERISTFKIGNWDGGAYTHQRAQAGEFSHCAASARYRSGTMLVFSIDKQLNWAFGLVNTAWHLNVGESYRVRYRVDRGRYFTGSAMAVTGNQVKVELPGDDRLFSRVRRGRLLSVLAANQTMKFALTSTNRMLSRLYDCAQYGRSYSPGVRSNPFSSGGDHMKPEVGTDVPDDASAVDW